LIRRAQHLSTAMPTGGAAAVVAAATDAPRPAEDGWDWDAAAQQWESAVRAAQIMPDSGPADRDELVIARLAALARAGRAQTVLDTIDVSLDTAAGLGQTSTVGRLAAVLLRTAGAWP